MRLPRLPASRHLPDLRPLAGFVSFRRKDGTVRTSDALVLQWPRPHSALRTAWLVSRIVGGPPPIPAHSSGLLQTSGTDNGHPRPCLHLSDGVPESPGSFSLMLLLPPPRCSACSSPPLCSGPSGPLGVCTCPAPSQGHHERLTGSSPGPVLDT